MDVLQLRNLRDSGKWGDVLSKVESFDIEKNLHLHNNILNGIIDEYYMALFYTRQYEKCVKAISYYERSHVNDHIIHNTDYILAYLRQNKKVIATTDADRKPNLDEIVVVYGSFPWTYKNLIVNNPCYRHFKYFQSINHDIVEYDKYWDGIDKIYIISLETREDRYLETVKELLKLNIPLGKISKFPAILNTVWGCSASHLEIVRDILKSGYQNVIVLEDDFSLSGHIKKIKQDIKLFLERKYDYDVCLLACQVECKLVEHDDLLCKTYTNWCTTCSGYIMSKQGAEKVLPVWTEALEKIKRSNDSLDSCDVSWQVIQKDGKMFQFKDKVGFQRPQNPNGRFTFFMY